MLPEEIALLAAVTVLHLWLASRSGWVTNRRIRGYHDLALQLVPAFRGKLDLSNAERMRKLEEKALAGDHEAQGQLDRWRETMRDRCTPQALGLQHRDVQSVSVDSVVARSFKIRASGFKVVDKVGKDGITFAETPEDFKREARQQAMELYCLKKLTVDWQGISALLMPSMGLSKVRDDLSFQDFSLRVFSGRSELGLSISGGPGGTATLVGTPVLAGEWLLQRGAESSEASSLDEFRAQVVKSMPLYGTWLPLVGSSCCG